MSETEFQYTSYELSLSVVGLVASAILILIAATSAWDVIRTFVLPLWKPVDLRGFGSWAVITGSSCGIGKSYARELARLGYNIILISNEMQALKENASEIEAEFGVSSDVVCTDFSKELIAYDAIKKAIDGKEVRVLVNNVGSRGNQPCYFLEETEDNLLAMGNINCLTVVIMTNLILPSMVRRNRGIIINVSSVGALFPMPLASVYSATKRFVDHFSRALQEEYRDTGLVIQSVFPFYVCTRMTQFSDGLATPSVLVPDSDTYVRNSIRTVGVKRASTGYWPHAIMSGVLTSLPVPFLQYLNFVQGERLRGRKHYILGAEENRNLINLLAKAAENLKKYTKYSLRFINLGMNSERGQ